jgi:hypothetical protein
MSRLLANILFWGVGWGGMLATGEFLAMYWKGCPWSTLSAFAWRLQVLFPWLTVIFIAGMSVLISHVIRTKNVQEGD